MIPARCRWAPPVTIAARPAAARSEMIAKVTRRAQLGHVQHRALGPDPQFAVDCDQPVVVAAT